MSLRIAIIGSGPAGLYSAKNLVKHIPNAFIDIFEKLPAPYGLLRYGVAPDHIEIKNVINEFQQLFTEDRVRFFGNVEIGKDIMHKELCTLYSGIIYCYGASQDIELNIPGGEQSFSARRFVEWYNGHPYSQPISFKNVQSVSIIGNGNVAVDVARILGSPIDRLAQTEISSEVLEELQQSELKEINMIGRRGAIQSAMTVKELRALSKIPGLGVRVFQDEIKDSLNEASKQEADLDQEGKTISQTTRIKKKVFNLLNSFPQKPNPEMKIQLNFRFLKSPVAYQPGKLTLEKNRLEGPPFQQRAIGTGDLQQIDCDLLFRSIGYKTIQIDSDIPFDLNKNIVQNENGRVQDVIPVYAAGWCKTGPQGIIDSTMRSVLKTLEQVIADYKQNKMQPVDDKIKDRITDYITFQDWQKLDKFEIELGNQRGKVREKVKYISEMIRIAKS